MNPWLKIMVLLAIQASTVWTTECDDPCFCPAEKIVDCDYRNLTQPPPGYWPDVTHLRLRYNHISVLHKSSLTGFPNVIELYLERNLLTELDFEVFSVVPSLAFLDLEDNAIATIAAAPRELKLASLSVLSLYGNRISTMDPNALQAAPSLSILYLNENPLTEKKKGEPFLNQPLLDMLDISDTDLTLQSLDPEFFKGLPNLGVVLLYNLKITSISGTFVDNPNINFIGLSHNQISEVTAGTFAPGDGLVYLELNYNPLQRLDVSAVADSMMPGGFIYIDDTPLACSCGYESLYWWAKGKGVQLFASCTDKEPCVFVRKANIALIQENDD